MSSDTDVTTSLDANQLDVTAPAHDGTESEAAAEAETNVSTQLHAEAHKKDPIPSPLPKIPSPLTTDVAGLQATVRQLQETMEKNMALMNAQMGFMMEQLNSIPMPSPNPLFQPTSQYGSVQYLDTPPVGRSTLRPTGHSVDRSAQDTPNTYAGCPSMEPSMPRPMNNAGRPTLESSTPLQRSPNLLAHLAATEPLMDQTANSPANENARCFTTNMPHPSRSANTNKSQNRTFGNHIIDGSNDPDNDIDNIDPTQFDTDSLEQIYTRNPHRKLFGMFDMKIADPKLYYELIGKKQLTTTTTLLHKWVSDKFPDVKLELETALAGGRGPLVSAAMAEYRDTLTSTLDCNIYVAVVMLMKAIATDPLRAQQLDAIIRLAVNMESPQSILDHIPKIRNSGMFDRSKSHHGMLEHSPSYQEFDYKQNRQANMWWWALGQLVTTWWGWNPASNTDQKHAEQKWLSAEGGGSFVQTPNEPTEGLIAREEKLYQDRVDAAYGRPVCTDDQRVKNLLQAAKPHLQRFLRLRLSLTTKQVHNLKWYEFLTELEKAGSAPDDLFPELHVNPDPKPSRPQQPHTHTKLTEPCWNWSHVGECEYNPCRYLHVGKAGAKRSEVCDDDGYCLKESKHNGCTSAKCPFNHKSQPKCRMNRKAHLGSPKNQTSDSPFRARIAATVRTQGLLVNQGNADSEEEDIEYIEPRGTVEERLVNAKVY